MRSPTLAGWAFILGDPLGLRFARSFEKHCAEQTTSIGSDQSFGLGFGIDGMKSPLRELGSAGKYRWGGFYSTAFSIDPEEHMIVIFMTQLHPTGDLTLDRKLERWRIRRSSNEAAEGAAAF